MEKQKIKIVRKNDEYSAEYQVGDVFQVDSTWYGGVNVTSASGIPLSLDKDEYVLLEEAEKEQPIDNYSYQCGVMDCFCEMVASGLKKLAMSHPCDTKAERDSYLPQVKKLCEKYGILYHPQDEALITDLFPAEANQDKYNYLFFRTQDVYETYLELKKRQKEALATLRLYGLPEYAHEEFWKQLDIVYFLRHDASDIAWQTRTLYWRANSSEPIFK